MAKILLGCLLLASLALTAGAAESQSLDLGGGVTLELVAVKAGAFKMGSPPAEAGRNPDEEAHDDEIKADFLMGKFPVTRGQFACFARETGYRTEAEVGTSGGFGFDGVQLVQRKEFTWRNPGFAQTDEHPVVMVTLGDARAFAAWLSRKTGRKINLPTEAQWEYACRAGTATRFYSGDADAAADAIAWFKDNAGDGTRPVGLKKPNAFGLYDFSGNVYEWCVDVYGPYRPGGAVQGPQDKQRNVVRGGSWLKGRASVRSAARFRAAPGSRNADFGFRIVAAVAPAIPAERPIPAAAPPAGAPARAFTPPGMPSGGFSSNAPPFSAVPRSAAMNQVFNPVFPHSSPFASLIPFMFFVIVGIVILAVILKAIKSSQAAPRPDYSGPPRSAGGWRQQPNMAPPRLAEDGFWFDTTGYLPGSVVRYSYLSPQGPLIREFVVEPGTQGQFIYTGARPEDLLITGLIAQQMTQDPLLNPTYASFDPAADNTPNLAPPPFTQQEQPFSGFPSAY